MQNNEIYTFELDYFHTKKPLKPAPHNLLKHPSFSELNKLINDYPSSPPTSNPSRPASRTLKRPSSTSRMQERSQITPEPLHKECTFHPKISSFQNKENARLPLKQNLQRLAKPRSEIIENREKLKRRLEIEQAVRYNYTPEISNYQVKGRMGVLERTNLESKRYEEREKMKRVSELRKEEECTFKPMISRRAIDRNYTPIYDRVELVQVEKLKKQGKLRQKYEKDYSFKPEINQKSRCLSSSRGINSYSGSYLSSNVLSRAGSCKNIENLDSLSPLHIPAKQYYDPSGFINRQEEYAKKTNTNSKIKQAEQIKSYTFTPTINKTSAIIVDSTASPKSLFQKMRKLSDGNVKKLQKQAEIREGYYSQFSHSPILSKRSEIIGRTSSLDALCDGNYKQKLVEKRMNDLNEDDMKNCTFSPDIYLKQKYNHVKSAYGQPSAIMKKIEQETTHKREKTLSIKYQRDYEELKNCSFRPEISKRPKGNVVKGIKGLDRYFELKQMARRIANEKSEREIKAFVLGNRHETFGRTQR